MDRSQRGRPRINESSLKARVFSLRLAVEELCMIESAARRCGVGSVSTWARKVLMDAARLVLKADETD